MTKIPVKIPGTVKQPSGRERFMVNLPQQGGVGEGCADMDKSCDEKSNPYRNVNGVPGG
jgi:hypothetical protein